MAAAQLSWGYTPGIVAFALLPIVIFGFMDTMYLARERAYRDLYARMTDAIRNRSYALQSVYEARAPLRFDRFCSALASWSIFPIYFGLILAYLAAHLLGWLDAFTSAGGGSSLK
jgi:hypothetical protein